MFIITFRKYFIYIYKHKYERFNHNSNNIKVCLLLKQTCYAFMAISKSGKNIFN